MKKIFALLLALTVLLTACAAKEHAGAEISGGGDDPTGPAVGISLPDRWSGHWKAEGDALTEALAAMGITSVLEYAGNDPQIQSTQLDKMIAGGVDCLVIAAVDSLALTETLTRAKEAGVFVIAYDRMLMSTDSVSCYVGFDHREIGAAMGEYIVKAKQLNTAAEEGRTYTIEFFMGPPEDNNALLLHQGLLDVLLPYLDSGVLTSLTGRVYFEDTCLQEWSRESAKDACDMYIWDAYTEQKPDIFCAASDALAAGVCASLEDADYTAGDWPLIVGQDIDQEALERILLAKQGMSVYKDSGVLTEKCAELVRQLLAGGTVETSGISGCENGVMTVPGYLFMVNTVTGENYKEVLADSGIDVSEDFIEGMEMS